MRIVSTAFLLVFLITSSAHAAINGVAAVVNGEMITVFDLQAETAPEAMRRGGLIALCVAFAVGIVLGFACGWPILAFGLVGIAGGYGYTSGFWPYKYHACGPVMVFLLMGPLMALPAYYIQGGSLDWRPFLASLPIASSSPASCTPTTSATSRTTARPGSRPSPCCWAAGKPCACTLPCA